jgi:hypothetical protein
MRLNTMFNSKSKGINFSNIDSDTLTRLEFTKMRISIDLRDRNAESRLYHKLKQNLNYGDVTFILLPNLPHHIPIITTMIDGITKNLPYIVYFDSTNDPDLIEPLVTSLSDIRYKSSIACKLESDYALQM